MKLARGTLPLYIVVATYAGAVGALLSVSIQDHRFMTEQELVKSGYTNTVQIAYLLFAIGYTVLVANRQTISSRRLMPFIVGFSLLALAIWPILSLDAAAYLTAAKNIVVYGVNPMREAFTAVPHNLWAATIMPTFWFSLPVLYGPLFFLLMLPLGAITNLTVAVIALKLFFASVWVASAYLIKKRMLPPRDWQAPLALILLNPLALIYILVDVHNEVLVLFFTVLALVSITMGKPLRSAGLVLAAALIKISSVAVWPVVWFDKGKFSARRALVATVAASGIFLLVNYLIGNSLAGFHANAAVMGTGCLYICPPGVVYLTAVHIPLWLAAAGLWMFIIWRYLYTHWQPVRFVVWSYLIMFGVATTWFAPWYLITPVVMALVVNNPKYTKLAWIVTFIGLVSAASAYV